MSKTKRDMIITWAERGYDIPTIAKLLDLSEDEVRAVLIHQHDPDPPKPRSASYGPEFIEPPLFD